MEFEVISGYDDGIPNDKASKLDPRNVPWPLGTTAVVGRDDSGRVVAFSAILVLPHVEGTWVAPEYQHSTAAARLVTKVEDTLKEQGGTAVFAFAHDFDPQIKSYIERFKYLRMPFSVYMKELKTQ